MTNLLHEGQAHWAAIGHRAGRPVLMRGAIHFAQKMRACWWLTVRDRRRWTEPFISSFTAHIGFSLVWAESSVQYCRSLISKWERQIKSGEKAVAPLGQPATNAWFWSNLERSGSCRNWFPKDHCEDFELSLTPSLWCLALKSQPYFATHPEMPCAWGMTKWMALSYLCHLAEAL